MKLRAATIPAALLALSCAGLQDHVEDASDKRAVVCGLAANSPGLERVRELCEADATLREIAAAYAGCAK